jgi:hypothetical protein
MLIYLDFAKLTFKSNNSMLVAFKLATTILKQFILKLNENKTVPFPPAISLAMFMLGTKK